MRELEVSGRIHFDCTTSPAVISGFVVFREEVFARPPEVPSRKQEFVAAPPLQQHPGYLSHPLIFQAWCVCPASTLSSCQSLPC